MDNRQFKMPIYATPSNDKTYSALINTIKQLKIQNQSLVNALNNINANSSNLLNTAGALNNGNPYKPLTKHPKSYSKLAQFLKRPSRVSVLEELSDDEIDE
tara:strand:+ start:698 stop:1000 length:303 start_codon:yes stop_codon:yes gene_type:complete